MLLFHISTEYRNNAQSLLLQKYINISPQMELKVYFEKNKKTKQKGARKI
jgi:hypothetical protein